MVQGEIEKLLEELTPVTLLVQPAGADVMIDGKSVGTTPVVEVQYVDPGEHMLMIQLEGHETYKKAIVAKRGEPLEIEVTLVADKEPEQPAKVVPPPEGTPIATEPVGGAQPKTGTTGAHKASKGGIGIFLGAEGTALFDESHRYGSGIKSETGSKMDAGVYVGVFGEKLIVPYLALGAEASLIITDVDESRTKTWDPTAGTWSYPNPWLACESCERHLVFSFALRVKCPIPLTGVVAIYPLATVGIGTVTLRYNEKVYANRDTLTFFGMSYSGGIGVEFYTPAPVTPFLEIRYTGGFGTITSRDGIEQYWIHEGDSLEEYMIVHHALAVGIGARFL
jgi:hypothetical protein